MDLDNGKRSVIKHSDTDIRTNNVIIMLEQTFARIVNSRMNSLAKYIPSRIYSDLQYVILRSPEHGLGINMGKNYP